MIFMLWEFCFLTIESCQCLILKPIEKLCEKFPSVLKTFYLDYFLFSYFEVCTYLDSAGKSSIFWNTFLSRNLHCAALIAGGEIIPMMPFFSWVWNTNYLFTSMMARRVWPSLFRSWRTRWVTCLIKWIYMRIAIKIKRVW